MAGSRRSAGRHRTKWLYYITRFTTNRRTDVQTMGRFVRVGRTLRYIMKRKCTRFCGTKLRWEAPTMYHNTIGSIRRCAKT